MSAVRASRREPGRVAPASLLDVLRDVAVVEQLDEAQTAAALVELTALGQRLGARAWELAQRSRAEEDVLLTADEAAKRLNVSPLWLRRRKLACEVILSAGAVRWSARGLANYIAQRTGRGRA